MVNSQMKQDSILAQKNFKQQRVTWQAQYYE